MKIVLTLRLTTSAIVLFIAIMSIATAVDLLGFAWNDLIATSRDAEQRLRPYTSRVITATLALGEILRLATENGIDERTEDNVELLSTAPLQSLSWLDLAFYRGLAGDREALASSLALSVLTGPNEGRIMVARASFALTAWVDLPPDLRRAAIADLTGAWPLFKQESRDTLKRSLSKMSLVTRAEIHSALLLTGGGAEAIAATLDLTDQAPRRRTHRQRLRLMHVTKRCRGAIKPDRFLKRVIHEEC